jgi:acetyl esterase/lipase
MLQFKKHFFQSFLIFISLSCLLLSPLNAATTITKILALGDNITGGATSVAGLTPYLYPLWEKLFRGGYMEGDARMEFIGPNSYSGRVTIKNVGAGLSQTAEDIDATITSIYTQYPADIVLLHAGHNHDAALNPVPSIIAAHRSIIAKILAINPNAKILMAQVIPSGKLPKYSYIPELNTQLASLADELNAAGKPVTLVNQAEGFNWATDCVDNMVHPNALGADKMATKWYEALEKVLPKPSESFNPQLVIYKQPVGAPLQLHIFKPANMITGKKYPSIVFFFGGGWSSGTPIQFYREASYYASRGMVAICADYRIAFTHNTTPLESIKDAKSVIRWMRTNAAQYGINPDSIAAAGASAGGHLAAASGTLQNWDETGENLSISSKPNLMLLYYAVIDNGPSGYGPASIKDQYLTASPLHNINATTPPCIMLLGTKDQYVPVATAQLFQKKMLDLGIESELSLYTNAVHPIFLYQDGKSENYYKMLSESTNFLIKHKYIQAPTGTGLSSSAASKRSISPNPTSDKLTISGLNTVENIKVFNAQGCLVSEQQTDNEISVAGLAKGMYTLKVNDESYKLLVR